MQSTKVAIQLHWFPWSPRYVKLVYTRYTDIVRERADREYITSGTGDPHTATVKQSQRRVTSPTSKMFRQHLKCRLTAPRRAGTSIGFFFGFFLLSQLSEPGRLGTASGPASRLARAMTFSGCDTSPMVDCCSFSICRTQSPEELGKVGERSLG